MNSRVLVQASSIGFAAGFTLGCVGWGGAQIIKPSLTSFLSLSQIAANGASLASLSVAGTVSAAKFLVEDRADLLIAASIAVPSVISARAGVVLAQRMSSEVLALIFNGMSVILIPTHYFVQQYRDNNPHKKAASTSDSKNTYSLSELTTKHLEHAAYGLCAGMLSALMGVGGAPLTMSYLTLNTELDHHMVQGTMLAAVIPSVLTSAGSLLVGGHTPVSLAAAVALGSSTGSYVGAKVALCLTEDQLRHLYMASLVILGGRSLVGAVGNVYRLSRAYLKKAS